MELDADGLRKQLTVIDGILQNVSEPVLKTRFQRLRESVETAIADGHVQQGLLLDDEMRELEQAAADAALRNLME